MNPVTYLMERKVLGDVLEANGNVFICVPHSRKGDLGHSVREPETDWLHTMGIWETTGFRAHLTKKLQVYLCAFLLA